MTVRHWLLCCKSFLSGFMTDTKEKRIFFRLFKEVEVGCIFLTMSDCRWRPVGSSIGSCQCGAECLGVYIAVKLHYSRCMYTRNLHAWTGRTRKCQQNAYLCDMLTAHACTNVHMTADSIMTLVSLPPDQSFHVPLDIRQRHSFPQQLEKRLVCSCLNLYKECIFTQSLKGKLFLPTL